MSTTLAFTLRSLRLSAGLSQNALARQAGIDPAYVHRIEKGGVGWQHPSRAVLTQLASVMRLNDYETGRLLVAAGHWPWNLPPEDTRLLLEIGSKIVQAAGSRTQEATA